MSYMQRHVNLSGAENQCQGAVIDGLSAMLLQEITVNNGRIQQSNFDTYPVLRIADAPNVGVHFIQDHSHPPTGAGEPALPPLAPALCGHRSSDTDTPTIKGRFLRLI